LPEASKQASKQAGKQANKQASKQACIILFFRWHFMIALYDRKLDSCVLCCIDLVNSALRIRW
jgi:hypothetical protein